MRTPAPFVSADAKAAVAPKLCGAPSPTGGAAMPFAPIASPPCGLEERRGPRTLTPARTTHGPWKVDKAFPKQYMLIAVGHSGYTSGRLACSLATIKLAPIATAAVAGAGAGHGSCHWRVSPYTVPMQPRMKTALQKS